MNKTQNYWITAMDVAEDMSWTRLRFETITEDGDMVELSEELWERNAEGKWELTDIESGDAFNTFAFMNDAHTQEYIDEAVEQEDEPYFFASYYKMVG